MKVSEKWLREWVNTPLSLDAIADKLTMSGCEVEAREPVATAFTGIVVGQVLEREKHPDADKLSVCKVDNGRGETLHRGMALAVFRVREQRLDEAHHVAERGDVGFRDGAHREERRAESQRGLNAAT